VVAAERTYSAGYTPEWTRLKRGCGSGKLKCDTWVGCRCHISCGNKWLRSCTRWELTKWLLAVHIGVARRAERSSAEIYRVPDPQEQYWSHFVWPATNWIVSPNRDGQFVARWWRNWRNRQAASRCRSVFWNRWLRSCRRCRSREGDASARYNIAFVLLDKGEVLRLSVRAWPSASSGRRASHRDRPRRTRSAQPHRAAGADRRGRADGGSRRRSPDHGQLRTKMRAS